MSVGSVMAKMTALMGVMKANAQQKVCNKKVFRAITSHPFLKPE